VYQSRTSLWCSLQQRPPTHRSSLAETHNGAMQRFGFGVTLYNAVGMRGHNSAMQRFGFGVTLYNAVGMRGGAGRPAAPVPPPLSGGSYCPIGAGIFFFVGGWMDGVRNPNPSNSRAKPCAGCAGGRPETSRTFIVIVTLGTSGHTSIR
jgi:hypothetical protein